MADLVCIVNSVGSFKWSYTDLSLTPSGKENTHGIRNITEHLFTDHLLNSELCFIFDLFVGL